MSAPLRDVIARGGAFTHDPFPRDADVAVMAGTLPQYSAEIIQRVIAKVQDAHLVGEMLAADRSRDR